MYEPEWKRPSSVSEALAVLADAGDRAAVIAGGTDLTPVIGKGVVRPPVLVDLGYIDEMRRLDCSEGSADGGKVRVEIGATVSHARLAREAAAFAPSLAAACRTVGGPQIRARGTIGGNVANASPAADGTVALVSLGASAVVESEDGRREVPLTELLTGPGETTLRTGELVTALSFERPSANARGAYRKAGQRNALAIAVASVAVTHDPDAGTVGIALGSVAPTPLRATEAERIFANGWSDATGSEERLGELITAAAKAAVKAASPIDDVRASAWYRTVLVDVLTRRALTEACG
jgi:carbon-monoxide dehydrogenase medium subunit